MESEIHRCLLFYVDDEFLNFSGDDWSRFNEVPEISTNSWYDISEYERDDKDEDYIEYCDDDIGRRIFGCKLVSRISFPVLSPIMYSCRDRFPRLQEYIGTDEDDEEKGEKIIEKIDDESEETIGEELLEKLL